MEGKDKPPADAADNFRADPKAAQAVLAAGVPLIVVPDDATANLKLEETQRLRLVSSMKTISESLVNRDAKSTMKRLVDQAYWLLPTLPATLMS